MVPPPLDTRILVCEGPCNPNIKEYDEQVVEYGGGRSARDLIIEWSRGLKHTQHVRISGDHWQIGQGWSRYYKCEICGTVREF